MYGGSARTLLRRPGGADAVRVEFRGVTSNFFQVAGIAIERGRPFDGSDTASSQPVILIDELVAAQLLNDGEPVNAMLISGSTAFRVKGVVSSVRMAGPTNEPVPMMYQPLSQRGSGGHQLLIRTAVPAGHAVPRIAEVVSSVMPGTAAPAQVSVVEDQFARMILFRRVAASVMSVFGAIAFVLAFVGVFAVVSTTVAERTREIAIRVALGASRPRILLSQLKVWTGIAVGGIGVGVLGALAMLQLFRPVMFQVDLLDVSPYLAPMIAMIVATLVGTLGPALRATRIDPAITLRE